MVLVDMDTAGAKIQENRNKKLLQSPSGNHKLFLDCQKAKVLCICVCVHFKKKLITLSPVNTENDCIY